MSLRNTADAQNAILKSSRLRKADCRVFFKTVLMTAVKMAIPSKGALLHRLWPACTLRPSRRIRQLRVLAAGPQCRLLQTTPTPDQLAVMDQSAIFDRYT